MRASTPLLGPLLLTALLVPACDSVEPEPELEARVLVGDIEGTDIVLGALLDGDTLAVYQCGGDDTFDSHTLWFRGAIGDDDTFEVERDGLTLVGTRSVEGLDGELVEADGTRHAFHVDPVEDDDDAGVYIASEAGLAAGVVVLPQGDGFVAQGAACDDDECFQVIILPPLTITTQRIPVQVMTATDTLTFDVVRTLAAPAET